MQEKTDSHQLTSSLESRTARSRGQNSPEKLCERRESRCSGKISLASGPSIIRTDHSGIAGHRLFVVARLGRFHNRRNRDPPGRVPSYYLKQLSQAVVLELPGVDEVLNEIDVFSHQSPRHLSRDKVLRGRVSKG